MRTAYAAASVADECRLMGRCSCGGDWKLTRNEVAVRCGAWVDFIGVRCSACGRRSAYEFDISSFFEPRPGVWNRRKAAPLGEGQVLRSRSYWGAVAATTVAAA